MFYAQTTASRKRVLNHEVIRMMEKKKKRDRKKGKKKTKKRRAQAEVQDHFCCLGSTNRKQKTFKAQHLRKPVI